MDGTDRISKLPEPILQHILSFLVVKDAAKTSILSKVWNNAWTSLSCLNFGNDDSLVDHILENRRKQKISIQRFMLKLPYHRSTSKHVDNMVDLLVACNIKELFLKASSPRHGYHKLHKSIFAAKALIVLSLTGFRLELPLDGIKFSSLRELHLDASFLDEQLLQALCTSCNDLEVVSFRSLHGLTSLQVAGTLPKLRMVKLQSCSPQFRIVDIVAHNLRDLYICSFCRELDVIEITACKTLKCLNLKGAAVTEEWVKQLFSCLLHLEIFYLETCALLKTMEISSDRLKCLTLDCNNLTAVHLNTPKLLRFSCHVRYKKGLSRNVDPLPMFKLNASPFLEAVLYLIPETVDTNWYSKLTESLGNFNHSRAIELDCNRDKVIVIPKGMRENLLPPLHRTKHLQVNFRNHVNYSFVDVVDSLLWTSPQLDTLSFGQTGDLKTLKFLYRDAADEDEKPCCASLPWKCWRHALKIVKLQNFICTELQNLRSYFFTNTCILEIIEVPPEYSI